MMKTEEKYYNFWKCLQQRFPIAFKDHCITTNCRYLCVKPGDRTVSIGLCEKAVCVRLNVPSSNFAKIEVFMQELETLMKQANLPGEFKRPAKNYKLKSYASFCVNYPIDLASFSDSQKNVVLDWVYNSWLIFRKYCDSINFCS